MNSSIIKKKTHCRACKKKNLEKVFSLGPTPLANAFFKKEQLDDPEQFFPLDVYFCNSCSLLQLRHVVSPEVLFRDYVYVSSTSPVFMAHFEKFAQEVLRRFHLNSKSLVVDIGSNDGILLKPFKKLGIKVLGIEPATKIAQVANQEGIETWPDFFSLNLGQKIIKEKGKAAIVTATNVFAHIDDLDEVIYGVKRLLTKEGIFIIEAPYLVDFLRKNLFDTVYHEHLSYFMIKPLITLFKRFNMEIFDVQKVSSHGGSLRIFVKKAKSSHKIRKSVANFLVKEKKYKLSKIETYLNFAKKIYLNKARLISLLIKLKLRDKKIAGYGAPAKGNTLLNFFGIGEEMLDFIVDDSSWKQGLYSPGKHIPVMAPEELYKRKPDYCLILAWNFAKPIMERHDKFKKMGGKFIIPVPIPRVV